MKPGLVRLLFSAVLIGGSSLAASAQSLDTARAAWINCVESRAIEFSDMSAEPAATIVEAAIGACGAQQSDFRIAWARQFGWAAAQEDVPRAEEKVRAGMLGIVLRHRSQQSHPEH